MSINAGSRGERRAFMALWCRGKAEEVKYGARMLQRHSRRVLVLQKSGNILCAWTLLEICYWVCSVGSFSVHMARTRERQPCRRGPGRGAPSRPPAMAEGQHQCCCCCSLRRAGIPHLQVSQFMDTFDPEEKQPRQPESPAFGSAVFKLGNFNAHVSILFVIDEETDLEGANKHEETTANPRDQDKVKVEDSKGKEPLQTTA